MNNASLLGIVLIAMVSLSVFGSYAYAGPIDDIINFIRSLFSFGSDSPKVELKCRDANGFYGSDCAADKADLKWSVTDKRNRLEYCRASSTPETIWFGYREFAGEETFDIEKTTTFTLMCRGSTYGSVSAGVIVRKEIVRDEYEYTYDPGAVTVPETVPETAPITQTTPEPSTGIFLTNTPENPGAGGSVVLTAEIRDTSLLGTGRNVLIYVGTSADGYAEVTEPGPNDGSCPGSCFFERVKSGLTEGAYQYYAEVVEGSELRGYSAIGTFTVSAQQAANNTGGNATNTNNTINQTNNTTNNTSSGAPEISVVQSPEDPLDYELVTISATATDDADLHRMLVYVDGQIANTCTVSGVEATCEYTGYLVSGEHTYYATAEDASGNTVSSQPVEFIVYEL